MATAEDSFPEGDAKWKYSEGDSLFLLAQGPVFISRWVRWMLHQGDVVTTGQEAGDSWTSEVDITVRLPPGTRAGDYVFVGHCVMTFPVANETGVVERVDVASVIPDSTVEVIPQAPMTVSDAMKYVVGVASGIFGAVAMFCLIYIIYHRKHAVMRLAQSPFLATEAGSCLVAITFTFTYLPTRDIFCVLRGPMIYIPLTMVAAVLVGRLWRVYMTLSVALNVGRAPPRGPRTVRTGMGSFFRRMLLGALGAMASLPTLFRRDRHKRKSMPSLRRTVSAAETWSLIFFLILPQMFLQIFGASYYDREVTLDYDEVAKVGRMVCEKDGSWTILAGTLVAAAMYLLAVMMAWIARDLPSAFNETDQILQTSIISLAIVVVTFTLDSITNESTTSPDVKVRSVCVRFVRVRF